MLHTLCFSYFRCRDVYSIVGNSIIDSIDSHNKGISGILDQLGQNSGKLLFQYNVFENTFCEMLDISVGSRCV